MDPRSDPLQNPLFTLKGYPAGDLPGQPCPLAGLLLRLQSLPVLGLHAGGPAVHPPLPAAVAAHSPADSPQWLSRCPLAGGRPSFPEDGRRPLKYQSECWENFLQEKPFLPQGFSLLSSGFIFPFPFLSLKQKQNPLFVNFAVLQAVHLAVCISFKLRSRKKGEIA